MKLGLFLMPSHPPERDLKAGQEYDLEMLRLADRFGYSEAWFKSMRLLAEEVLPHFQDRAHNGAAAGIGAKA